jgi:hypothetical protein
MVSEMHGQVLGNSTNTEPSSSLSTSYPKAQNLKHNKIMQNLVQKWLTLNTVTCKKIHRVASMNLVKSFESVYSIHYRI